LRVPRNLVGDQNVANASRRQHFGFGQLRGGDADGPGTKLHPRQDGCRLVNFGMGRKFTPCGEIGHALDIAFDGIQIHQERGAYLNSPLCHSNFVFLGP
jgi:hypothetical protein